VSNLHLAVRRDIACFVIAIGTGTSLTPEIHKRSMIRGTHVEQQGAGFGFFAVSPIQNSVILVCIRRKRAREGAGILEIANQPGRAGIEEIPNSVGR
jgi:hypothetical protein